MREGEASKQHAYREEKDKQKKKSPRKNTGLAVKQLKGGNGNKSY